MQAYLFRAALWCEVCTAPLESRHAKDLPAGASLDDESTYDSDQFPKGPYPDGGGEADTPQHCDGCNTFLENPLTPDGVAYVLEAARNRIAPPGTRELTWSEAAQLAEEEGHKVLAVWLRFYQLDLEPASAGPS